MLLRNLQFSDYDPKKSLKSLISPLFTPIQQTSMTSTPMTMQKFEKTPITQDFTLPVSKPQTDKISWQGTNYDPYSRAQNRPNATSTNLGIGAGGVKIDETMVAVPRQKDGVTGMLRMGTVIEVNGKKYLVADLMSSEFNGQNKIDFATPKQGSKIIPEHNQKFSDIKIIRQGNGRQDLRDFIKSGQWEKMKNG